MSNSDIRLGITIRADGSAQVTGELNRVRESVTGAGNAAQNTNRQFADMARSTQSLTSIMSAFGITLGAVGLVAFGKDLLRTIEQVQNMEVRLKGLTKNTQDYAQVQSYLSEVSARHHKNNLVLADSFSRLLTLEQSGLITRKQSTQLLEGMSNAASKTGASTEQLKQSMFGFSQALGSGTVHMEELNQVTEPMPGLLNKIASASGYTVGEFRNLVAEGRITSEVFGKIMVSALEGYQGAAEAAGDTLTAKYADISNAWTELAAVVESPVSDVITPVLEGIASVVAGLTQDFRELGAVWDSIMGKKITGGAPDNGMQIDLTGRAKPPESDAAIQQAAIRAEIEKTAATKTQAAATHVAASKHIASGLSEEQRAAKAAAEEAKRNYDQAIKSSEDYIKRLKDETAQIGMNTTERADFAAEQIAATMADAKVRSEAIVQFLNEAHQLTVALEKVKEAEKMDEAVKTEMDALIDRYQQLTLSAEEYYAAKLKTQGMSAEQAAPLIKQNTINNDLEKQKEAADAARQALESYTSSIDSASSSMQNLGDVTGAIFDSSLGGVNQLVGAFENMLKGIDQSKQAYADLAVEKKKIDDFQPSLNKDQYLKDIKLKSDAQTKYEKEYQDLQNQTFNQYMDGTRQMAGALTSMFEDNKTAQIANQAVALVTLGIQAVQAIVTQGQGDPYTAFARIAAMAAIVAGLVASVGGKSPRPSGSMPKESPTTGTVLGNKDTSSKSVENIIKTLEDIHADEYAELRGINDGIRSLATGITSVVTRVFQNGGLTQPVLPAGTSGFVKNVAGFLIPKKTTYSVTAQGIATDPFRIGQQVTGQQYDVIEKKVKSLFSTKTSYFTMFTALQDNVTQGLSDIFNSIGQTMLSTADALGKFLGIELKDKVLSYVIPALTIDLKGLNAEDALKKVNGVISTALDNMAASVFGDIIGQYQQLGEGMLETAVRLVSEIAVVTDALKASGLKLNSKNILEFSDAIVQAVGGLNAFKKAWQTFFDAFYSDAEKQARLKEQLFGKEITTTRTNPNKIAQDLFGAKSGGPTSITDYIDGQLTDLFKIKAPKLNSAQKKAGLTVYDVFPDFDPNATLKTLMASREGYRKVLESININTVAGQKQYATLIKMADAADQYYDGLEAQQAKVDALLGERKELELQLMESTGQSVEALAERRKKELEAMDESLRPLQEQIYLAQDKLIQEQKAKEFEQKQRGLDIQYMQATGNAAGALAAKREDELAAMEDSLKPMQIAIYAAEDMLEAQQKAEEFTKKRRGLEISLMEAQGNATGALAAKRSDELAVLEDSLKPMQIAIYAAEDMIAAQQKANELAKQQRSLDIALMEAQGNAAGALAAKRADELAAIDESLRATQLAINAALDLAEAQKAALEAQKELAQGDIDRINAKIKTLSETFGDWAPKIDTVNDKLQANKSSLQSLSDGLSNILGTVAKTDLDKLKDLTDIRTAITNFRNSLADAIDEALMSGMKSAGKAAYLVTKEARLWAAMGTASNPDAIAGQLQSVTIARIQAQAQAASEAIDENNQALQDAYDLEKENRSLQIDALNKQIEAAQKLKSFADDLRQSVAALKFSDLSPLTYSEQMGQARALYEKTLAGARSGNESDISNYTSNLNAYLEEAQKYYSSSEEYKAIFNQLMSDAENLANNGSGADLAIQAAQAQLSQLEYLNSQTLVLQSNVVDSSAQQVEALQKLDNALAEIQEKNGIQIDEQTLLIQDQISELQNLVTGQQAQMNQAAMIGAGLMAELETATAALNALNNPATISINAGVDGSHAGGLNFVPFDGYRAELHRGERVLTASQVQNDGAISQEIVAELRALREEVTYLRSEQRDQTGALIQSNYDANDKAADKVADGSRAAARDIAWASKTAPVIA